MIGIMGAMPEEVAAIVEHLTDVRERTVASRLFRSGVLFGHPVTVVESRWGKVAAAITATHLLSTFEVDGIIFTGVAGAIDPELRVGDIVVGRNLYQHDMDASPFFPPMEIPGLGLRAIPADADLSGWVLGSARQFVEHDLGAAIEPGARAEFHLEHPRVIAGDIATGDRFVASVEEVGRLRAAIPGVACVEMEGAAAAQVCIEHGAPFAAVRVISDRADHAAPVDFPTFLRAIAGRYALGIMKRVFLPPGRDEGPEGGGASLTPFCTSEP